MEGKKVLIKSDGIFISSNDVRLGSSVENDLEPVVKGNELKKIIDLKNSNFKLNYYKYLQNFFLCINSIHFSIFCLQRLMAL